MKKKSYQLFLIFNIIFLIYGSSYHLYAQKATVRISELSLFKSPNNSSEVIVLLHKGDTIELKSRLFGSTNWIKINYKGAKGYFRRELLDNANFNMIDENVKDIPESMSSPDTISLTKLDTIKSKLISKLDHESNSKSKEKQVVNNDEITTSNEYSESLTKTKNIVIEKTHLEVMEKKVNQLDTLKEELIHANTQNDQLGFKSGFEKYFKNSFIPILLISIFLLTKKGVKDGRFSGGYRPSTTNVLLAILITVAICSAIGLVGGVINWF